MADRLHAFVRKATPVLRWIPLVNMALLAYWMIRTVFIARRAGSFAQTMKTLGLFLVTALLAVGLSWLLTKCIAGLTQKQANAIIGPLYLFFVLIPLLISLEVRLDEEEKR